GLGIGGSGGSVVGTTAYGMPFGRLVVASSTRGGSGGFGVLAAIASVFDVSSLPHDCRQSPGLAGSAGDLTDGLGAALAPGAALAEGGAETMTGHEHVPAGACSWESSPASRARSPGRGACSSGGTEPSMMTGRVPQSQAEQELAPAEAVVPWMITGP